MKAVFNDKNWPMAVGDAAEDASAGPVAASLFTKALSDVKGGSKQAAKDDGEPALAAVADAAEPEQPALQALDPKVAKCIARCAPDTFALPEAGPPALAEALPTKAAEAPAAEDVVLPVALAELPGAPLVSTPVVVDLADVKSAELAACTPLVCDEELALPCLPVSAATAEVVAPQIEHGAHAEAKLDDAAAAPTAEPDDGAVDATAVPEVALLALSAAPVALAAAAPALAREELSIASGVAQKGSPICEPIPASMHAELAHDALAYLPVPARIENLCVEEQPAALAGETAPIAAQPAAKEPAPPARVTSSELTFAEVVMARPEHAENVQLTAPAVAPSAQAADAVGITPVTTRETTLPAAAPSVAASVPNDLPTVVAREVALADPAPVVVAAAHAAPADPRESQALPVVAPARQVPADSAPLVTATAIPTQSEAAQEPAPAASPAVVSSGPAEAPSATGRPAPSPEAREAVQAPVLAARAVAEPVPAPGAPASPTKGENVAAAPAILPNASVPAAAPVPETRTTTATGAATGSVPVTEAVTVAETATVAATVIGAVAEAATVAEAASATATVTASRAAIGTATGAANGTGTEAATGTVAASPAAQVIQGSSALPAASVPVAQTPAVAATVAPTPALATPAPAAAPAIGEPGASAPAASAPRREFAARASRPASALADAGRSRMGLSFGLRSVDAAVASVVTAARELADGKVDGRANFLAAEPAITGRGDMEIVPLDKDFVLPEAEKPDEEGEKIALEEGAALQLQGGAAHGFSASMSGGGQQSGHGDDGAAGANEPRVPVPSDVQDASDALWLRGNGPRAAAVSLEHPDLGPVNLVVQQEQGRVDVRAMLTTPAAANILRANESALKYGLQQAGMTLGSLAVRTREESGAPRAKTRGELRADVARKRRTDGWEA